MNKLRSMEVFEQVVAEAGFAACARKLDISPSVVTRLIGALENELGVRLIQRSTRRLALTPAGEAYLERVKRILAEVSEAEDMVRSHALDMSGAIRVSSLPGMATHLVAPAVADFRLEHPHVTIELRTDSQASRGVVEAQRLLGALILRGATTLQESEQALGWLHEAARAGDVHAHQLLHSLVLPVEGEDAAADAAIVAIEANDRWLAGRLRIAREFGLTKLEALCFDPVEGRRPWGLVVGKNPFIAQIRLSAPRAIPALGPRAHDQLRDVAEFFASSPLEEGDLRRRSHHQRRLFAKLGLDESWFFATASSVAL